MRRMSLSAAAAVLAALLAAPAGAGEAGPGQFNVTVGGGLNVPSRDAADNGYVIGGSVGYHLSPRLVLGGEVSYFGYQHQTGTLAVPGGTADYDASQHYLGYVGTARYVVREGRWAPYVKGLAGGYRYGFDSSGAVEASYTRDDLQYGGGLGLLVLGQEQSNLYVELLARQISLETGRTRLYSFTVGMDISFLP